MKIKKILFWAGISLVAFMILSYFTKLYVDTGANYNVRDSLLGIVIFHSLPVFVAYILIIIALVVPYLTEKLIAKNSK
jgi:uncharacterized BrkB/YihY/UPF0761 family membrane protein